jgi:predicted alpha/beta superfamily hydrolase
MNHFNTVLQGRIVLILLLSLLLGLNDVVAQSDPKYLSKKGILDTVHSEVLNEERLIYVDFPMGYDPASSKKYPVAFLLDGDVLLTAAATVQDFYSGGFTPDMIIIGISNAENRTRDLTPPKFVEEQRANSSDPMAVAMTPNAIMEGGAPAFLDFIENELIPYVEVNYPVTNFRTLIGHSYGGLFTIYTLSERPSLFNYYLAIDPSMNWSGGHYHYILPEKLSEKSLEGRSVFLTMSGQLHMQDTSITLDNVREDDSWYTEFPRSILQTIDRLESLAPNGLRVSHRFFERDLHGTVPLPSLMEGIISLFDWYQMEGTHQINDPETSVAALSKNISYRATKLERNFGYAVPPYPEELMNVLGYMAMDMGNVDKSQMYFEAGLKYYPESANAHDSMADYYEAVGDVEKALAEVIRAQELSPSEYYQNRINKLKN